MLFVKSQRLQPFKAYHFPEMIISFWMIVLSMENVPQTAVLARVVQYSAMKNIRQDGEKYWGKNSTKCDTRPLNGCDQLPHKCCFQIKKIFFFFFSEEKNKIFLSYYSLEGEGLLRKEEKKKES